MASLLGAKARLLLEALYGDLSRDLEPLGLACRRCGRCCHFDEVEHRLFASRLERLYLLERARESGVAPRTAPAGRCPFQTEEACLVHAMRPLGCRVFFCDLAQSPLPAGERQARLEALSAEYHNRLQALHRALGVAWDYGPLLEALARP
ncbi:MAG: YkgJ family cysteine cluster protein [Planctomycetota bacterium]